MLSEPRKRTGASRNRTLAGFDDRPLEGASVLATAAEVGGALWRQGGAVGGPPGGARVSGVRGGALQRGHRRLPIAHNETALSAGSGAEGKHGEGAQPGQKEAEDRGGGGECLECFLPASLPDSPPGWVSGALASFQSRGRTCPESYVGSILRRPSCPNCEDRGVPRPAGLSSWLRVCIFTLCQTLRGQEKKGFGWRQLALALWPAGGTSEPHRGGRSLPASWSPRWLRGREYGDALFFSASGLEDGN